MSPSRRARATLVLSLLLPLAIYSAWAARFLRAGVGYEYDEALWTESAVYMLRGSGTPPFAHEPASWISLAGRQWPLMILPYEGAAKALVALPLFAALGVTHRGGQALERPAGIPRDRGPRDADLRRAPLPPRAFSSASCSRSIPRIWT